MTSVGSVLLGVGLLVVRGDRCSQTDSTSRRGAHADAQSPLGLVWGCIPCPACANQHRGGTLTRTLSRRWAWFGIASHALPRESTARRDAHADAQSPLGWFGIASHAL